MNKTITIFGSSKPLPGEYEYEIAYHLGKLLGENGFNVCTGGYQGIMDAISKGATEMGREAIGITVKTFHSTPSKYLTREIQCETLTDRILKLIETGDGYIILPGGTGTLLELAMVWESFNKNILNEKPVFCLGGMWKKIVEVMEERIKEEGRKNNLIKCCDSIFECVEQMLKNQS